VRENGTADSWDAERDPSPEQRAGSHQGPLVVYPIDRSTATPLTATCPTDVMRNTLGVGPCQYILACEGLAAQGDPTPNSVMGWVEKQFEQKKDKKAADDLKERLDQMTKHVADAQARIDRYAESAAQVRKALAGQPGADQFLPILDDLARFAAAGRSPAAVPAHTRELAGEVLALIGQENAIAPCRPLGEQLRAIGAVQDRALAKCRMMVRRLQAQGRTIAAGDPAKAKLAQEVERLAERILHNE
jgi:soluble cytochrome b562